jgi:hypothetical protein
VRDATRQAIAYLCSRENADEARQAKVLTADEARRIAINIARLPELLGRGSPLNCKTQSRQISLTVRPNWPERVHGRYLVQDANGQALALPLGAVARLDQGEEPGQPGDDPGAGCGVVSFKKIMDAVASTKGP